MKKILLTMVLVLSCLFVGNNHVVLAAEGTLSLDGTKVCGETSIGDETDYLAFTLDESGSVTINIKSYMEYYHWRLYNSDMESLSWKDGLKIDSSKGFRTDKLEYHLTAGTYYFEISGYSSAFSTHDHEFHAGKYEVSATTVSANETFKEPNNGIDNAQSILLNSTIKGQIAHNDKYDFYEFELPSSGELTFNMSSYMEFYRAVIYNEEGNEVWFTDDNKYNEAVGYISKSHEVELTSGIYYIKISGENHGYSWAESHPGNYSFDLQFVDAKETFVETNKDLHNDSKTASILSVDKNIRGHLAVNDTKDIYKVEVSKKCRLSVDVTSYVKEYAIAISDSNGKDIYNEKKIEWDEKLEYKTTNHFVDVEAGTYFITIAAGYYGNYDLIASELILLNDCDIKMDASVVCTGKEVEVPMTIKYNGTTLKKGVDYTTEYKDNIKFGTARVIIKGMGKYAGSVQKEFQIVLKTGAKAESGDYQYKYLSDTTVAVCGVANKEVTTVEIYTKVSIGGKWFDVTAVAGKAFYKNTKILSVSLPNGIIEVGKNAFNGCTKITKITFDSAPRIYAGAFTNCKKLKTVDGLETGTVITLGKNRYTVNGKNTLEFIRLENEKDTALTIPSTVKIGAKSQKVTAIAAKAVDKTKIKTATIGKYVSNIGNKAFQKCTSLTKVSFKGKNITIGAEVFDGCKKLKTVEGSTGSVLTIGKYKYKITGKTTVAVAGIKDKNVKKITIGTSVKIGAKTYKITSVAKEAFRNTEIKSVTLGQNITSIDKNAFENCRNLKNIYVRSTKINKVGAGAFKNVNSKIVVKLEKSKMDAYKKMFNKAGMPKTANYSISSTK